MPAWLPPLNGAAIIIFIACAGVQYNDPDALSWAVLYILAAAFCAGLYTGRLPRVLYAVFSVSTLLFAFYWFQLEPRDVDVVAAMQDMGMVHQGSERIREIGGLFLVGAWMAVLGFYRD